MIQRAVILAAGRVRGQDTLHPLIPMEGTPLLHLTIRTLVELGITEIAVVVGWRGNEIRESVAELPAGPYRVTIVENPDWRRTSGISLLTARDFVVERCFCILGDRMVHKEALAPLQRLSADAAECVMLVDTDLDACADLAGATKVKLAGGKRARVVDVGADLAEGQAFDCGHCLVSPELLVELAREQHPTVSDGLRALARRGLVAAHEIGGRDWRRIGGFDVPRPDPRTTLAHVEGLLEPKDGRYVLMNPGPVNTTARVKSALVHHDVCHRDSDYSEVLVRVSRKLRRIFRGGPEHTVVLITGSGTAAMECAIASTVAAGRKLIVLDNGAFGERMAEIAAVHALDIVHLRRPWGETFEPGDVAAALAAHPDAVAVAMCHHETSVGLLNPISEIGALCRRHGALLLVDAVSSLGAEDLDVERDHIDICWSSANKCLHGISGVSFLCVSPRVWPRIADVRPRAYYLDLERYRRYATDLAQTPFTPAVATYFALDVACDEYLEDGAARRQADYAARNQRLRDGLAALGLVTFTATGRESHTIVTPRLPDGVSFGELYEDLKSLGFVIYDCKPPLRGTYFQVANMGDLTDATIDAFLAAFAEALARARARSGWADKARPGAARV
ncbi:MAG TPA: aminotransferase class V-fold PLP-dependent enzyme [Haliangiales bacterium]|nr:aminotransferase class V-fold PLP-dependent enzyme [Haliangiales bacterium]